MLNPFASANTLATSAQHLQTLLLSFHPVILIETVEEERVLTLLQTAIQDMKISLYEWSITQGLLRSHGNENRWVDECAPPGSTKPATLDEKTTDPLEALKYIQAQTQKGVFWLKDFTTHLTDPVVARQFREVVQVLVQRRAAFILTGESIKLPPEIAHDAVYFELKLPGRDELHQAVSDVVRSLMVKNRVQVQIQEQDLQALVQALSGMTLKQARQVIAYAALEDGKLTVSDIERILHRKAQVIREEGVLEYLPLNNQPLYLGGFTGLKRWLARAKVGFTPQARELNLRPPRGILIVGIQGCGKSLAAKAIAQEWKLPLLKLDAGRLYDKYVGESEKNFRQAAILAESMSPTVLWIDEIEKSFSNSDSDSDGGLSRRLFGFFLTWLQEKSQDVFVVATANDISKTPPELFRKGRFDEIFFADLPDAQERGMILKIHLGQRKQPLERFDLATLVKETEGYSGAEIEQAVIVALYNALYLGKSLDTALLIEEIRATIPLSVSRREDLEQLRAIAQERFVSVR
ncbi:AAA family ATPase [Pantanalinema sp. GBBB05]|uniref:AAA family ATPase n=1 Tax=Pantanalinema sp. GBBB05 TaxID=2604139 RepID=UPI001D5DC9B5|nr:AAA family ATPase [Pantanalinema sp. GBBB05]